MRTFRLIVVIMVLAFSQTIFAEKDPYSIRGFLSLGAVYNSADANYDENLKADDIDYAFNNVVGIQFAADLNEKINFTSQIIARGDDDYDINLNWAFLSYEHDANLSLKVGRIRAPIFLVSDYLDVGHAYPWPRPTKEVYWQIPMSSNSGNGVEAVYQKNIGDWFWSSQLTLGRTSGEVRNEPYDIDAIVMNTEFSNEYVKFRASYAHTNMTYDLAPLFAPSILQYLSQLGITGIDAAIYNHLLMDKEVAVFTGMGVLFEKDSYLAMAEYGEINIEKGYPDSIAWYLTLGYRWSDLLVYGTTSNIKTFHLDKIHFEGNSVLEQMASPVINQILDSRYVIKQTGNAIGIRYDITPSMDVKIEYKLVDTHGTVGLFNAVPDGNERLITVVFDMIF